VANKKTQTQTRMKKPSPVKAVRSRSGLGEIVLDAAKYGELREMRAQMDKLCLSSRTAR
jgi:hypothetical protein